MVFGNITSLDDGCVKVKQWSRYLDKWDLLDTREKNLNLRTLCGRADIALIFSICDSHVNLRIRERLRNLMVLVSEMGVL